jgi:hypothetical protein
MLMALLLLTAARLSSPDPALTGQLYAAIWDDLELNALIGNWIASLWSNAGSDDPDVRDHHILDLRCRPRRPGYRCAFRLFRDGGVSEAFGEAAPDRLACTAIFLSDDEHGGLMVKHLPPTPHHSHSQTTMRCRREPAPRNR